MGLLNRGGALFSACLLAAAFGGGGRSQATPLGEAQAKAMLLYNLGAFVDWPAEPSADPGTLVIGVSGDAAVLDALNPLQGRTVGSRAVVVRAVEPNDDPRGCQILFLASTNERVTSTLVQRVGSAPVLTVGDSDGFTEVGGIVRVYFDHSRLRFEISLPNARRARLHISAKLLGLARVVTE